MSSMSIHTGQWTDYSHGAVLGAQVTIHSQAAQILIAFIALFTGLVGTVTWKLLGFVIYWSRFSDTPRDGLDHQMNALFRNVTSPIEFGVLSFKAGLAWKAKTRYALLRSILFGMLAMLIFFLFSAAGILTSYMATNGSVLVRSPLCGQLAAPDPNYLDPTNGAKVAFASTIENNQNLVLSSAYVKSCYPSQTIDGLETIEKSGPASDCNFYVQSRINATTSIGKAPCPFKDGVCTSDVVQIDSGLIDSHHDLGINAPASGRIKFRRIDTCAIMATEGFTTNTWTNNTDDGDMALYFYGRNQGYLPSSKNFTGPAYNATFAYSANAYTSRDVPYKLMIASSTLFSSVNGMPLFNASSNITDKKLDWINLFFLANRVNFLEPVHDPWFNATKKGWWINSGGGNATVYTSENPGGVIGCVKKTQLCNPNNNSQCTPMDDVDGETGANGYWIPPIYDSIGLNDLQRNIADNISTTLTYGDMYQIAKSMGESSLVAYNYLVDQSTLVSQGLPDNQWITELQNWFNIGMAYTQRQFVVSAQGHTDPLLVNYTTPWPAADKVNNYLCLNQKVKSSAYASFSVLGLALVFAIGGMILILCACAFTVLPIAERKFEKIRKIFPEYKRRAWQEDGLLQLQRQLYAKHELGEWEGRANDFPTTKKGQVFKGPTLEEKRNSFRSFCAKIMGESSSDKASTHESALDSASTLQPASKYLRPPSPIPSLAIDTSSLEASETPRSNPGFLRAPSPIPHLPTDDLDPSTDQQHISY